MLAEKIFENIEEGVMINDTAKKSFRSIRLFKLSQASWEEVIGRTPKILQSGLHNQAFYDEMWDEISIKGRWYGEIWNKRKDGQIFLEWRTISSIMDDVGKTTNYVAVFSDIYESWCFYENVRYHRYSSHGSRSGCSQGSAGSWL
ncbi:PAS domain-containing protein [Peribacillus glennii]|uniref:PAS domain-containing protein n=1 Tax=Peribacillus glennii TaxID=2303991 RepID=UPI001314A839|nr:PAS domain-containing protein [Peribacillus glennii]